MTGRSSIEWTEATWNPTTGCTRISPGCRNCYAAAMSKRLRAMGIKKYENEFEFAQHDGELDLPLRWKRPRLVFVNSMSDLFHEDAEDGFILRCFETMERADWHTYQVLTKRPERMAKFSRELEASRGAPVPRHVWMGTSVEDSGTARRIDDLRRVRCHVRFVSFEPLLEEIRGVDLSGIHWAIIGGESGPGRRPIKKAWVKALIRECRAHKVRVFFKQWGGPRPKDGGREVDGRVYDEYPAGYTRSS